MNLWVTVPVFNEEKTISSLLNRLIKLNQSDDFKVVFCDNNSSDSTVKLLRSFIDNHHLDWVIVSEYQKGTGAAADTAIRTAILRGATHVARTDADCLPSETWISAIKNHFETSSIKMISGRITARTDDTNITKIKAKTFDLLVPLAASFGKFRPLNQGDEFKGSYVMTAGCNMAIESELYINSGGFPRTKIEDVHEDHMLANAVRRITSEYGYLKDVHVEVSARRIAEWGIVNTMKWYANHSYRPEVVDIR
jgi:glycosyltransferase involved in cell wall biosynthesis